MGASSPNTNTSIRSSVPKNCTSMVALSNAEGGEIGGCVVRKEQLEGSRSGCGAGSNSYTEMKMIRLLVTVADVDYIYLLQCAN